jgi:hypothetical protein
LMGFLQEEPTALLANVTRYPPNMTVMKTCRHKIGIPPQLWGRLQKFLD